MKERPIMFSAPMVNAILEGKKTQTRRALSKQPRGGLMGLLERPIRNEKEEPVLRAWFAAGPDEKSLTSWEITCPYGKPGDRLWVRETWGRDQADNGGDRHWNRVVYRADPGAQAMDNGTPVPWKPSIHMPRWTSRITLEITDVRVERLQAISEEDAVAEGIGEFIGGWACLTDDGPQIAGSTPQQGFRHLWERINGPGSWDESPWVWVVEFKRVTP